MPGEQKVSIAGPIGQLVALSLCPESETGKHVAIVCHPHSQHGGTMQNKVVTTLARMFRDMGICSVRFNFRGVGESVGEFDRGFGETEDLLAVLKWTALHKPQHKIILVGFSFGSFVAFRAASRYAIAQLVSVAPPVHHFAFHAEAIPECPWLVLIGEEDEVVPPQQVYDWVASLSPAPKLIRMPQTSHFFHGKLLDLKQHTQQVIQENL